MDSIKVKERIEELKKLLHKLEDIENMVPKDIDEEIYIKYIYYESIPKVRKYIDDKGYRINGRKYTDNDISEIIRKKDLISNEWISQTAKSIFNRNKKKVAKVFF